MIHVALDPLGGLAGDMFAAAMIDALPHLAEPVHAALAAALPGAPQARTDAVLRRGLRGRRFEPADPPGKPAPRDYRGLHAHLDAAGLPPSVASHAAAILGLLADAEAAVHAADRASVHFHEIGAWDTVADVVAAGAILAGLEGATWSCEPLPIGHGRIESAHGLLPVPAPATAHLLRGLRLRDDGIGGERVTPTGAAILAHIAPGPMPAGRLTATGYGAGARDMDGIANLLVARVLEEAPERDLVARLAFEVDDMTGEEIGEAAARLRAEPGVRDLTLWAGQGKKGRPVTSFALLVEPGRADELARACFLQTATLGLRIERSTRLVLRRELLDEPPRKAAIRPDGTRTVKPEAEAACGATLAERRAGR